MRTSGFTSYVAAEGVVEGVGLVIVLGDMGEVDSGIRDRARAVRVMKRSGTSNVSLPA